MWLPPPFYELPSSPFFVAQFCFWAFGQPTLFENRHFCSPPLKKGGGVETMYLYAILCPTVENFSYFCLLSSIQALTIAKDNCCFLLYAKLDASPPQQGGDEM